MGESAHGIVIHRIIEGLDEVVDLPELHVSLRLVEVYGGVTCPVTLKLVVDRTAPPSP